MKVWPTGPGDVEVACGDVDVELGGNSVPSATERTVTAWPPCVVELSFGSVVDGDKVAGSGPLDDSCVVCSTASVLILVVVVVTELFDRNSLGHFRAESALSSLQLR